MPLGLCKELKRRNVLRMAVAYGVASWLLLQVADVLSGLFGLPDWTLPLVGFLLLLGFLPAMIFSWVYELTPEGLKLESEVDPDVTRTADTGQRINTLIIIGLSLAVVVLLVDRVLTSQPDSAPAGRSPTVCLPARNCLIGRRVRRLCRGNESHPCRSPWRERLARVPSRTGLSDTLLMNRKTVRVLRLLAVLAVAVSIAVFVPWTLLFAWMAPLPDTVQEQLDDTVGFGLDGIIVYVDRAGSEPETFTAGWKNRDARLATEPDALFKIASIRKLYIAAAAARLISRKLISLEDTLADQIPELVDRIEYADTITLKQMLRHRSGIPNFTDHPDFPWTDPPKTRDESLSFALDLPADFAPGSDYAYSNTNYLLIAKIIDQVLEYDHQEFIKAEVLEPLGLENTFASMGEVDRCDMMSGYFVGYDSDIKNNDFGSMIATAEDVGIFLRALNDGSLLDKEEQAIYSAIYEYEHTGLLPGYSSIARYHDDLDAVVVQFVNTSGRDTWTLTEIVYGRVVEILRRVR